MSGQVNARSGSIERGFPCEDNLTFGPSRTLPEFYRRPVGKIKLIPTVEASVRRQCLGTCSINATVTYLELLSAATTGTYVRFAIEPIITEVLIDNAIRAQRGNEERWFNEESHYSSVIDAIKKVGLIPEATWRPKSSFFDPENGLRTFRDDIKTFLVSARAAGTNLTESVIRTHVHALARERFGAEPARFQWNDRSYSALEFLTSLGLPRLDRYEMIDLRDGVFDKPPTDFEDSPDRYVVGKEAWEGFSKQIDRGRPVLGTIYLNGRKIDKRTGVLSNEFVSPLPSSAASGHHLVVFTGYELDKEGKLAGLFFQNSWGPDKGLRGTFEITRDYLLDHNSVGVFLPPP